MEKNPLLVKKITYQEIIKYFLDNYFINNSKIDNSKTDNPKIDQNYLLSEIYKIYPLELYRTNRYKQNDTITENIISYYYTAIIYIGTDNSINFNLYNDKDYFEKNTETINVLSKKKEIISYIFTKDATINKNFDILLLKYNINNNYTINIQSYIYNSINNFDNLDNIEQIIFYYLYSNYINNNLSVNNIYHINKYLINHDEIQKTEYLNINALIETGQSVKTINKFKSDIDFILIEINKQLYLFNNKAKEYKGIQNNIQNIFNLLNMSKINVTKIYDNDDNNNKIINLRKNPRTFDYIIDNDIINNALFTYTTSIENISYDYKIIYIYIEKRNDIYIIKPFLYQPFNYISIDNEFIGMTLNAKICLINYIKNNILLKKYNGGRNKKFKVFYNDKNKKYYINYENRKRYLSYKNTYKNNKTKRFYIKIRENDIEIYI